MSAEDPERSERELEALLGRVEPEQPSPDARAEARRAFLAGERAGRAGGSHSAPLARTGSGMPHLEHPASGDAEPDGFSAWLAARSGAPARPEARQRARLAFLSAASAVTPVAPPSRSYRALVWLAAAAAILGVTLFVPEPDHWRVRLDGGLVLDEEEYAPGEEGRLAVELERSGWAETRVGRARFALGGVLEIELLPDSRLSFPALPELDGVATVDFELARGEAYLRTLGAYPGNPIRIRTDSAEVVLSGTTVGVLVDREGTCVCVAEGSVRVTSGQLATGSEDLPSQRSLRLFRAAAMGPKSEPFDSEGTGPAARHVQELLAFHQGR